MARIQGNGSSAFGGLAAQSVTLGAAVGSGNAVCGGIAWNDSAATIVSVTDDQANSYSVYTTGGVDATNGVAAALFYRANITNAPQTITVTFSAGVSQRLIIADEFSGLATASIFDGANLNVQATSPGTGADAVTSGSITPSQNGDLIYGYTIDTSGVDITHPGTGFTAGTSVSQQDSEYQAQATAAAIAATFTQDSGATRITGVLALKAAGASSEIAGNAAAAASAAGTLTPNQSAAPIADISAGAWVPSTGGSLYATLDEAAADDGDYITSAVANSVGEVRLASMNDPLASSSHTLRYRMSSPVSASILLTVMQGAVQIAQWTQATTPALTTYSHTLSGAEADAITDYTDLRVRIQAL